MQSPDGPHFASAEVESLWRYISSSLDRLMALLDVQTPAVLNWRPPAPDTNSIFVLANHTMENARTNVLGNLCGQAIDRDRGSEFTMKAGSENRNALVESWTGLRQDLVSALSRSTADSHSTRYRHHWRGDITGLEILIIVARHTAEHLGQAELTRDMAIAQLSRDEPNLSGTGSAATD